MDFLKLFNIIYIYMMMIIIIFLLLNEHQIHAFSLYPPVVDIEKKDILILIH